MSSQASSFRWGAEIKSLAGHSLTYGLAEMIGRVVSFLMIPVYTRYLSPNDYGIQEIVGISVEIIGIILGMGLADAVYRYYYDTHDVKQQRLVVSTAVVGWPILGFLVLSCVAMFARPIAGVLLEGEKDYIYIVLALGTLWGNQIIGLSYTYLRVVQKSGTYFCVSIVRMVVGLSLNIYFVVVLRQGVLGIFISNLIGAVVFGLAAYAFVVAKVGVGFSIQMARAMMRYSLPVVPANLASLAVNSADRYFIKAYISLAEAGIYSLGYKFGNMVFYLVRVPFMQIWTPRRLQLYRDGAPREIYAKVCTYFFGLMVFVALGISVFVHDVIKLITPASFWTAANYAPALSLCYVLYALDNHVGFGIIIRKRTEYWTYVNLVSSAANILFNFILISRYGAWGAVGSTFIAVVLKIIGLHLVGRKLYPIPFEWGRMAAMLGLAGLVYGACRVVRPGGLVLALCWDALLAAVFPVSLWVVGIIDAEEKRALGDLSRRVLVGLTSRFALGSR